MIDELFGTFPREFGTKRVFVKTKKEFYEFINKYNGLIHCFSTIYSVPEPHNYKNAVIDKIYFDFDTYFIESVKWFHDILMKENLKHCITFSGGGFNVFILTKINKLKYPKDALRSAHINICEIAKLKIGKSEDPEIDVDEHIVGDIARICRIPNTFNIKPNRRRYCIPLIEEDLDKDYDEICEMAQTQRFDKLEYFFGEKLYPISDYDFQRSNGTLDISTDENIELSLTNDSYLDLLPPLIRKLLIETKCGWRDRYITIICMKELGFPKSLAIHICKKYWTPQKFRHSVSEERAFDYIYHRDDLYFPQWSTLKADGYEVSNEDLKFKFYR